MNIVEVNQTINHSKSIHMIFFGLWFLFLSCASCHNQRLGTRRRLRTHPLESVWFCGLSEYPKWELSLQADVQVWSRRCSFASVCYWYIHVSLLDNSMIVEKLLSVKWARAVICCNKSSGKYHIKCYYLPKGLSVAVWRDTNMCNFQWKRLFTETDLKYFHKHLLESVAASDDEPRFLLLQFFRNRIPGSLLIHVWCICVLR